jgi:hypothetical protein
LTNLWRRQPTRRLTPRDLVKKEASSQSTAVASGFFEAAGAVSGAWNRLQYVTEPPSAGFNKLRYASEPPVSNAWNKLLYSTE